ncbi:MAG TPA: hypothetical protein VFN19_00920 [Candidatus Nanopelagicales bacterium]|nr:hypothetical protein [Candidatus Nanopelagicales bacterium]
MDTKFVASDRAVLTNLLGVRLRGGTVCTVASGRARLRIKE